MPPRKLIVGFLWRFVVLYGLMIVPWPGFNRAYGRYFCALGEFIFARENDRRIVHFEPVPEELRHRLDTRIALGNRDRVDGTGSGPVVFLELDTRGIGWVPTAVILALVLSTPVTWRRRAGALCSGILSVHFMIIFSVAIYIWNNSVGLGLVTLSPFSKQITAGWEETLITQMGASFVAPVLIWIFVALRRQDFLAWQRTVRSGRDREG